MLCGCPALHAAIGPQKSPVLSNITGDSVILVISHYGFLPFCDIF